MSVPLFGADKYFVEYSQCLHYRYHICLLFKPRHSQVHGGVVLEHKQQQQQSDHAQSHLHQQRNYVVGDVRGAIIEGHGNGKGETGKVAEGELRLFYNAYGDCEDFHGAGVAVTGHEFLYYRNASIKYRSRRGGRCPCRRRKSRQSVQM